MPNSTPKLKNDWTGYWKLMSKSERNPEEGARSSPSVTAWCQRSDSRTVSYWAYSLALATLSSWSLYGSKGHKLSLLYTSISTPECSSAPSIWTLCRKKQQGTRYEWCKIPFTVAVFLTGVCLVSPNFPNFPSHRNIKYRKWHMHGVLNVGK